MTTSRDLVHWTVPEPPPEAQAPAIDRFQLTVRSPTDHDYARLPRFIGRIWCARCGSPFSPSERRPTVCGPCWLAIYVTGADWPLSFLALAVFGVNPKRR